MHIATVAHRRVRALSIAIGLAGMAAITAHAAGTVGSGTPASCTEAALDAALTGGGAVDFNCGAAAKTIVLTTRKDIASTTSIDGGGSIVLDGNNAVQLFFVTSSGHLQLSGLSLVNGYATISYGGGAVRVQSGQSLTLNNVVLDGNTTSNQGGAIFAEDSTSLILDHVVANGNQAINGGGAVYFWGTTLQVTNSTFSSNLATTGSASGGAMAIAPLGAATVSIVNSSFTGNAAGPTGLGAALSLGNVSGGIINNSTFANNSGENTLITYNGSSVTLSNSIVSSMSNLENCFVFSSSSLIDGGNNVQFGGTSTTSCGAIIPVVDPRLGALSNNGGFADTIPLLAGSPAIDAGNNATCAATDERDIARPAGAVCDIGAFEATGALLAPQITSAPPPVSYPLGTDYNFQYSATGGKPISFSLSSGALPPGLSLSSAGFIGGAPTMLGTFNGVVSASNGVAPDAMQSFSIQIVANPGGPGPAVALLPAPAQGGWTLAFLIAMVGAAAALHERMRNPVRHSATTGRLST